MGRGLLFVGLLLLVNVLACPGDWGSMCVSGQGSDVHWNLLRNL